MNSMGSLDITQLAAILKEVDPGEDSSDSETETPKRLPSSKFGPGQIAPTATSTTEKEFQASSGASPPGKINNAPKVATKEKPEKIWTEAEVKEKETLCNNAGPLSDDPRKVPTYDIYFRQAVTTEDMFLQMGNKNASTASCETLVVEIFLPGEKHEAMKLDLKKDMVELRSPNYVLFLPLPQPINPRVGTANWDKDKEKLILSLVLERELDILNF